MIYFLLIRLHTWIFPSHSWRHILTLMSVQLMVRLSLYCWSFYCEIIGFDIFEKFKGDFSGICCRYAIVSNWIGIKIEWCFKELTTNTLHSCNCFSKYLFCSHMFDSRLPIKLQHIGIQIFNVIWRTKVEKPKDFELCLALFETA